MMLFAIIAVAFTTLKRLFDAKYLRGVEAARDAARSQAEPAGGPEKNRLLQETAIDLYAQKLRFELDGLRTRALISFIPGLGLCLAAIAGPVMAIRLAETEHHWEFMLGGTTLAAVLLAAGTALLRHDNKLREQVQESRSELLYFSRLKTGLDCAFTLDPEMYRAGLQIIAAHLLAAPPSLTAAPPPKSDEKDVSKDAETKLAKAETSEVLDVMARAGEVAKPLLELTKGKP
jgi:hypothetical protein